MSRIQMTDRARAVWFALLLSAFMVGGGSNSSFAFDLSFAPIAEGIATGTPTVVASNALAFSVPVSGTVPIDAAPIVEELILGRNKTVDFRGIEGAFTLQGGEVLLFKWINGFVLLNGKRFAPGPSRPEYLLWQEPRRKADLARYAQVPFVQRRIGIHGDTDLGWTRAVTEWDSAITALCSRTQDYYREYHDANESRAFMLSVDQGRLLGSVRVDGDCLEVRWLGLSDDPRLVELSAQPAPPTPTLVSRSEAMQLLRSIEAVVTGTGTHRVELHFGNINAFSSERTAPQRGGR